jgi:twitching motility protein PilT
MEDLHIITETPASDVSLGDVGRIFAFIEARMHWNIQGVERQEQLATLLNDLSIEDRSQLRHHLDGLLVRTIEAEAADIDFGGPGSKQQVWFRIYNDKKPVSGLGPYTLDQFSLLALNILTPRQQQHLFQHRNLDFSYAIDYKGKSNRFRGDLYFDLDFPALNMRRINNFIWPFQDYGFHPNVAKSLSLQYEKQGLILITGVTGSGKSTTLDSIIDANNHTVDAHIVIIANPVELVHDSIRCLVRHREVGRDVNSFKEGAVQSMRQDPDIIMIGEMRDEETIETCLEVTDTGHKVFSTLHTGSAVETIDRIIAECQPIEQERIRNRLADLLKVIVSQKLVPSLDGKRILAKEVLVVNASVKAAIKNNNTSEIYQMISESSKEGMYTLEQDLRRLFTAKKISVEEVLNFANNKRRMQELLDYSAANL